MFFIRLFLANTWEKNRGSPCLFPHKLLWKVDMVLRSQSGNLRGGDWGEIQNNANRVRSMHSRSSLFSVVFMCFISPIQKFKLEKNTLNTKEWGKSRFDEILELWIVILDYLVEPAFCLHNSSELLFDFLAFAQWCLTKKLEEKTFDSYFSYVRLFGVYTQQNVNSAANFVFTSKTGLPRVVLVLRWVLFVPEIFVSPLSEFEQHKYGSDPRPDTGSLMQLQRRRAVPQASQPP